MTPTNSVSLTGRHVVHNVGWSVLGQAVPIVAAVGCIPFLTRALGPERFGLLALSWTFVGYFSIFDLGLGQAMTRSVAQKLAVGEHKTVHVTVWTALSMMFALGTIGFLAAWFSAPVVVHSLRTSATLRSEALTTLHLLALSIPIVITSVGLRGVLGAHLKFKQANAVGIPVGIWTYVGPLLALPFTHGLVPIVAVLLLGRVVAFALYLMLCLRTVPSIRKPSFHAALARPLLRFGGWLTLDGIIDPATNFLDRFLIGASISVSAVAFYSVPYQLAAQGWMLASGLSAVLFPTFTHGLATNPGRARLFFRRGAKYLLFAMFPITLAIVAFAQPGLHFWLGPQFASHSASVLQLVAVGVLITSIGSVGGTFIIGTGRPDINAKLGIAKFILHFAPVWWVLTNYGIIGLAALWMACAGLEATGMIVISLALQRVKPRRVVTRALQSAPIWISLAIAALPIALPLKSAYLVAVVAILGVAAWKTLMSDSERGVVRSRLRLAPLRAASGG